MKPELPLRLVSSRRYALGALAGCFAFAALGTWLTAGDGGGAADWGGVAFFGGGALLFVPAALRSRVEVTIDRDGIDARHLRMGTLRWEDVSGAWLVRVSGQPVLCLELAPRLAAGSPSRWRRLFSRLGRALGVGDTCILLAGLRADADEVLAVVRRRVDLARWRRSLSAAFPLSAPTPRR